ncbi:MAG: hypothetical protein ACRDRH_00055 [Pseudonocardia sp.]
MTMPASCGPRPVTSGPGTRSRYPEARPSPPAGSPPCAALATFHSQEVRVRPQLPPLALDPTAPEIAPPANRAARRKAKAGKPVAGADRNRGGADRSPPVHSRSAQGRRINPVRRTG